MKILLHQNGQQYGPYSREEVEAHIESGSVSLTDLAWTEGRVDWMPLSEVLDQHVSTTQSNSAFKAASTQKNNRVDFSALKALAHSFFNKSIIVLNQKLVSQRKVERGRRSRQSFLQQPFLVIGIIGGIVVAYIGIWGLKGVNSQKSKLPNISVPNISVSNISVSNISEVKDARAVQLAAAKTVQDERSRLEEENKRRAKDEIAKVTSERAGHFVERMKLALQKYSISGVDADKCLDIAGFLDRQDLEDDGYFGPDPYTGDKRPQKRFDIEKQVYDFSHFLVLGSYASNYKFLSSGFFTLKYYRMSLEKEYSFDLVPIKLHGEIVGYKYDEYNFDILDLPFFVFCKNKKIEWDRVAIAEGLSAGIVKNIGVSDSGKVRCSYRTPEPSPSKYDANKGRGEIIIELDSGNGFSSLKFDYPPVYFEDIFTKFISIHDLFIKHRIHLAQKASDAQEWKSRKIKLEQDKSRLDSVLK